MNMSPSPNLQKSTRRGAQILFFVLATLCLLFVMSYASRLNEFARVQQDSALWGQKIEDAQRRQAELLAYRDYVQSDAYVAEVAREQLNMVQPGDNVVVVVASDASQELVSAVNNQAVEAAEVQTPIWRQWFNLFVQQSPTARTEL